MQEINTEEIMKQIRKEIQEKGLTEEMLSFEEIPYAEEKFSVQGNFQLQSLQQSAEYLSVRNQIQAEKPIEGNFLVVWVKKLIQKLLKFYILPVMTEQNALNLHTANAVQQISQYIQETEQERQELKQEIELLKKENQELREKLS